MLQSIHQSCCLRCSPTTFHGTLMRTKEVVHVLANGLGTGSMAISAIGSPYLNLKNKIFKQNHPTIPGKKKKKRAASKIVAQASLVRQPLFWAGCVCLLYVLVKIVGPQINFLSDVEGHKWMPKRLKEMLSTGSETQAADERRKMVRKWHPTTKGTLKRSYRVAMKSEGRRLLKAIASLLSDDDTFRDATSHKGCQIRRETAHGESVCCNNVRALFDELPTPHLVVEITAFPAGPLSERDYTKAEKIERILRTGATI